MNESVLVVLPIYQSIKLDKLNLACFSGNP